MARITEDEVLTPRWSVAADVSYLCERIAYAKNMASRRYIFIGETHSSSYDKARNLAVAKWVAETPGVIGIAERQMFQRSKLVDQLDARTIEFADNFWNEPTVDGVGPFADSRNVDTAAAIVAAVEGDRKRSLYHHAPVVIFFGQDHENRIRPHLEKQLTVEDRICWWSMRSIEDYLADLKDRRENQLPNPVFMGFTKKSASPAQELELLAKGKMGASFMLTVWTDAQVHRNSDDVLGVFLEGTFANLKGIENKLYEDGKAQINVHPPGPGGMPSVVVRPLAGDKEFASLAEALQARIA